MYEIPMTIGMFPGFVGEIAAFHQLLTALVAVWLGAVAALFLVIVPLAARSSEITIPSEIAISDPEVRDAA